MNRKEFYTAYRQARFLMKARSLYSIQDKVNDTGGILIWAAINSLHKSIVYAMLNRHKSTHYPLSKNRWAIKRNHKF